jgi:hypothetical protein
MYQSTHPCPCADPSLVYAPLCLVALHAHRELIPGLSAPSPTQERRQPAAAPRHTSTAQTHAQTHASPASAPVGTHAPTATVCLSSGCTPAATGHSCAASAPPAVAQSASSHTQSRSCASPLPVAQHQQEQHSRPQHWPLLPQLRASSPSCQAP